LTMKVRRTPRISSVEKSVKKLTQLKYKTL
jgi:hypothetical protein